MKLKTTVAAMVVSSLALAGVAFAEEAKKDEKKPAAMEMPKPGPEHKKLGYFVGTWNLTGEMKPGPMGPGGKMTGTSNCSWFDGGYAVVCKDSGKGPMGPMKGMGILTYDNEDKMYEYFGIDNMGMAEKAEGKVENDVWTYTSNEKMNGKAFKGRYTISNVKPDGYDFKFETSEDGNAWSTMMEGKYAKAGAAKKAAAKPEEKKS